MAQGADVDFDEDWYAPQPKKQEVLGAFDIASMIGLGYETES